MSGISSLLDELRSLEQGRLPRSSSMAAASRDSGPGRSKPPPGAKLQSMPKRKAFQAPPLQEALELPPRQQPPPQQQKQPRQAIAEPSTSTSSGSGSGSRPSVKSVMTSDSLRALLFQPSSSSSVASAKSLPPVPTSSPPKPAFVTEPSRAQLDTQLSSLQSDLIEQERLAQSLQRSFLYLRSSEQRHEQQADQVIHRSIAFLPTELLIKHGKFDYVKERALTQMWELLLRGFRRTLRAAINQWNRYLDSVRDVAKLRAGALIVRIARGFHGRLRMRQRRRNLDDAVVRAARIAAVKSLGLDKCATIIQCAARRKDAYRRLTPLLLRCRAAVTIQTFLRSRMRVVFAKRKVQLTRLQRSSAIYIQKMARAMLGRRRFHEFWLAARKRAVQRHFDTPESTFRYYFEQAGAAAVIQRWWRKLPYVIKASWRRKFLEFYTHRKAAWESGPRSPKKKSKRKNNSKSSKKKKEMKMSKQGGILQPRALSRAEKLKAIAELVNPIVRGFLGRMRVKRLQVVRQLWLHKRELNATRIQSHMRRCLVAKKMPDTGLRSRALVRKIRRWLLPMSKGPSRRRRIKIEQAEVGAANNEAGNARLIVAFEDDLEWQTLTPKPDLARRRGGVSYSSSIKIPNASTIDKMSRSALKIQMALRRHSARLVLFSRRQKKHLYVAARMVRWARVCLTRLRVLRFRRVMQPLFERCAFRNSKARVIQARWKTYAAMAFYYRVKRARKNSTLRLQRFARWFIARLCRKTALNNRRAHFETIQAGGELYSKTEIYALVDSIWQGAKKTRTVDVPHDMQKFFVSQGGGGQIDTSRVGKIAKEAGILGRDLDVKTLEMQFMKVNAPSEKRMSYSYWLELLSNIGAIKFLQIDPAILKGASNEEYEAGLAKAARGGVEEQLTPEQAEMHRKIKAFRFARFTGRTALLLKVTYIYLMNLPDWKKASASLGKKSAHVLAPKHVKESVAAAQKFVRNRLAIKHIHATWRQWRADKVRRRLDRFATKITTLVRGYLGRCRIKRKAQTLYTKYLDDDTQALYWFNPRSSASFWIKPRLLGNLDCGQAIRMPNPDDQCVSLCGSCWDKSSATYCDECDFAYCADCFTTAHRSGKRRGHAQLPLSMCVQCDFQTATKECQQCQDLFCDSCYRNVHSKGRLRLHIYNSVTDICDECGDRAAQWTQHGVKNTTGKLHWCVYCFRQAYNTEPQVVDDGEFVLKRYNYQGKTVREIRGQRDVLREKRRVALDYAERLAAIGELKKVRAATNIQRCYRGFCDRRLHKGFIAERRAFFVLRAKQRPLRESPFYKFLHFWGMAPNLSSDTMMERVKGQYPSHMQSILNECLRGQWREACRLQREQEDHLKRIGNPSKMQAYLARMAVLNSGRMLRAAESIVRKRNAILDVQKEKYRTARSLSKTPARVLKELMSSAEKQAKEVELAVAIKEEREEEVRKAEQKVTDFLGPRGLQKLVDERRKQGVRLPFTVSMTKGSCLALTKWDVPEAGTIPLIAEGGGDGHAAAESKSDGAKESPAKAVEHETEAESAFDPMGRGKSKKAVEIVPGKWAKSVKDFDVLLVQGMHFQVLPGHLYDMPEDEEDEVKKPKDDDDGDGASDEESVASAASSGEEEEAEPELYPPIPLTSDHIVLDRPWVFDSVEDVECFRAIPDVFYMRPLHALGNALLSSYVPQKGTAITAITLHKLAGLNVYLSSMFDEESETGLWLKENARRLEAQRDSVLRVSRSMVEMTYDFALRRTLTKGLKKELKILHGAFNVLGKLLKRAAADDAATAASYEFWEESASKVEVEVYIDFKAKPPRIERLGLILLDLKAPVSVMREYVQRKAIDRLNELQGDSFLFEKQRDDGSDYTLPRDDEIKVYSSDFCPFKMDTKTMEGANKVTIVLEPLEEGDTGSFIQPFKAKKGDHHHSKAKVVPSG